MNLPLSSQRAFYATGALGLSLFLAMSMFVPSEKATLILIIALTIMAAIIIPKVAYPAIIAAFCVTASITTYLDQSLVGTFLLLAAPCALWCYSQKFWAGKDEKMFVVAGLTCTALFIYALGWVNGSHPVGLVSIYLLATALFISVVYAKQFWQPKTS